MQNPVEMTPNQMLAFRRRCAFGKFTERLDSSENILRLEIIDMLELKVDFQLIGTQGTRHRKLHPGLNYRKDSIEVV